MMRHTAPCPHRKAGRRYDGPCPVCEQLDRLDRHITELVEECSTTEWVSEVSHTHHIDSPGLLTQAADAGRATLTRGGGVGVRRPPGSRPPGRWDLMTLTDFVHTRAEKLRKRIRRGDYRPNRDVVNALYDLQMLAKAAGAKEATLICGQVASWVGTAKVALGYAAPPAQTNLHCPECGTMLVAPQLEDGTRYLLCANQECTDADGRRRRWNEWQLTEVKAQQGRRRA